MFIDSGVSHNVYGCKIMMDVVIFSLQGELIGRAAYTDLYGFEWGYGV